MVSPKLIPQHDLCKSIGLSPNGLRKLLKKDPSFPRPIKLGATKQAPVFYDAQEYHDWLDAKKAERGAA
jgi:prophage regulatory protein